MRAKKFFTVALISILSGCTAATRRVLAPLPKDSPSVVLSAISNELPPDLIVTGGYNPYVVPIAWGNIWNSAKETRIFEEEIEDSFTEKGFRVVTPQKADPEYSYRFTLTANINVASIAVIPAFASSFRTLGAIWSLVDNETGAVVASTTTKSTISTLHSFKNAGETMRLPLRGAAKSLLLNQGWQNLLKAAGNPVIRDPIHIALKPAQAKPLKEVLHAALAATVGVNGQAAAIVISSNCLALTSYHTVREAKDIKVKDDTGREFGAKIVRINPVFDSALIQIEHRDCTFFSSFRDVADLGDDVIAVGNPLGEDGLSVSRGIVSATPMKNSIRFIQHDAKISPGYSGGPLVSPKGEVLGINAMKLVGWGIEGIAFTLPIGKAFTSLGLVLDR